MRWDLVRLTVDVLSATVIVVVLVLWAGVGVGRLWYRRDRRWQWLVATGVEPDPRADLRLHPRSLGALCLAASLLWWVLRLAYGQDSTSSTRGR